MGKGDNGGRLSKILDLGFCLINDVSSSRRPKMAREESPISISISLEDVSSTGMPFPLKR